MVVVRTVVTSLPKTASAEKTYRLDPAPQPAVDATSATSPPPSAAKSALETARHSVGAALGKALLNADLAQLLADLEAESRRVIGPTAPPRG